jgi:hypothetical protein
MKLAHLGDALDHWKGSLIEVIGDKSLRVVPMLTDRERWTEEHFEAYARLLHRKPEDVLRRAKDDLFSTRTRRNYFRDLGENDLFLDPDTGIAPDEKAQKEHISPSEIAGLLSESRSRILLIYQHASRKRDGVREKLELLRSTEGLGGCHIFAYDSGAVSMVVISQNRERTHKASACLKSWLGPVASARILEISGSNG